jgi:hypothetical protein
MKSRAVMLVFTACLVSSLAFADNPADAPLMSNSAGTPVEHQESCKDPPSMSPGTLRPIIVKGTEAIPNTQPL